MTSRGRKDDVEMGGRTRTIQLAQPPDESGQLERGRDGGYKATRLRRQSTSSLRGQVDGTHRVVSEFRTLSIQVQDTQREQARKPTAKSAARDLADLNWHLLDRHEVLQRLSVEEKLGLDASQVSKRTEQKGLNQLTHHRPSILLKLLSYVFVGFGSLLIVASVLCFIAWKPLGEPAPQASNLALAIVLLIVVVIQTLFNAWQDFSTSRVMASIAGLLPSDVVVMRDGRQSQIPAKNLVPGDLVVISLGQKLPADVRLIDVSGDLRFDRAILTGESEPVRATVDATNDNFLETKNIGLQGSLCVSGSGMGVVVLTGDETVFGRVAKLSSKGAPALTPLQKEILRFVFIIVVLAISTAVLIIILWAAWLRPDHPGFITNSALVIDIVSVCVAFIPEGLPACVTISQSVIAQTLAKAKVLCKSLTTVETLGSVSVLCSDKTGTLTKNQMTVASVAFLDQIYDPVRARDTIVARSQGSDLVQKAVAISAVCNAAVFVDPVDNKDQPIETRLINGNATDAAVLRFAEMVRPVSDSRADWHEVYRMNFSSSTKFMLTLSRLAPSSSSIRPAPIGMSHSFGDADLALMVKGAPDILLKRCSSILDPTTGSAIPLSSEVSARLVTTQEQLAAKGQRVILLAMKTIPVSALEMAPNFDDSRFGDFANSQLNIDLTVIGLIGIVDPPRSETPGVIQTLRGAGIRVFMVTGDFATTALAIAAECGIISNPAGAHHLKDLRRATDTHPENPYDKDTSPHADVAGSPKSLVVTGSDLMEMDEAQWEQLCHYDEIVFARTTPEQKLRIVKEFQKRGETVGMTGDGVNDAPSLKAADVGIAMGGGSEVAMEAADLVLLDSFASMVVAVEYGRSVFDNLKKTCLYLLPAGSFSELIPVLLNVLLGLPQILSNIQMILICVVTDVLPAISLCFEKPESGVLTRPPRNPKKDRLINWRFLLQAYFFLGLIESLCASAMGFWYLQKKGYHFSDIVLAYGGLPDTYDAADFAEAVDSAQSVYFFTLVFMQWGNLLSTRTRTLSFFQHNPFSSDPATRNWWIVPAMLLSITLMFFFSYIPFFQNTFLTRGVPVEHVFIPITFAVGIFMLDEGRKYLVRRYPKGFLARVAW